MIKEERSSIARQSNERATQREIGLSVENPHRKGYPPSVFALLPRLIERTGVGAMAGNDNGYVYRLAEGDDNSDPIVDIARASLDGQVMLSRSLADMAHYPAIDLAGSVSRVMPAIVSGEIRTYTDLDAFGLSINKTLIDTGGS